MAALESKEAVATWVKVGLLREGKKEWFSVGQGTSLGHNLESSVWREEASLGSGLGWPIWSSPDLVNNWSLTIDSNKFFF